MNITSIFLPFTEELKKSTETHNLLQQQKTEMEEQIRKLNDEIAELKTAVFISESGKQEEIELTQRKCQEEIASLQHIMKGAVSGCDITDFSCLSEENSLLSFGPYRR